MLGLTPNKRGCTVKEYFNPEYLKKFGDIRRVNRKLGDKFFSYFNEVQRDGALSAREKALIALAIAHYDGCPYCIDSFTKSCLEKGSDEPQMNEAVHVAAAMAAGITMVNSVQMMNHLDEATL